MKYVRLLPVFFLIAFVESAGAELITISATGVSTDPYVGNFTITYNDLSGDGEFSLDDDELVSFSGVQLMYTLPSLDIYNGTYDLIVGTPEIEGITDFSGMGISPNPSTALQAWNFQKSVGPDLTCCTRDFWTYTSSPAAVPVPAAVWLFGSGLLALIAPAIRRRVSRGR